MLAKVSLTCPTELEKLVDAVEAPGAVLAARFEDEVVPPPLDL
jgi:hypothetical protein